MRLQVDSLKNTLKKEQKKVAFLLALMAVFLYIWIPLMKGSDPVPNPASVNPGAKASGKTTKTKSEEQPLVAQAECKVTYPASCITMGLANLLSSFIGGMPLCHGAGGLAAHYRFGARTGGSNFIIGLIFILLAVFLGPNTLSAVNLIPMSILGVLLLFAGSQLGLTIIDLQGRKEYFVILVILGITLASNLAAGFIAGVAVAHIINIEKLNV